VIEVPDQTEFFPQDVVKWTVALLAGNLDDEPAGQHPIHCFPHAGIRETGQ